jgi:hypothetical protein
LDVWFRDLLRQTKRKTDDAKSTNGVSLNSPKTNHDAENSIPDLPFTVRNIGLRRETGYESAFGTEKRLGNAGEDDGCAR